MEPENNGPFWELFVCCAMLWVSSAFNFPSFPFWIVLRQKHAESLDEIAFSWNPPYMDPRNVTLRSAPRDTRESSKESAGLEGSLLLEDGLLHGIYVRLRS